LNTEVDVAEENKATRRLKLEMRSIIQKFKVLSRNLKTPRPGSIFSTQEIGIPSKELADQMTQLYISHFESAFRILHVPSFRSEYDEYWRDPLQASDTLRLKVHLVIAIGSSICEPTNKTDPLRHEALRWVHFAQNWVSGPLEKSRINISGLQIQCLLILARQALYIGGDLVWVSMGTVVRTAVQMGLHRDPKNFKNMTML
jgi:Fungal specific transcription factor domain